MPTQAQVTASLQASLARYQKSQAEVTTALVQVSQCHADLLACQASGATSQAALSAANASLSAAQASLATAQSQLAQDATDKNALLAQVAELQSELANNQAATAELQAVADALAAQAQAMDDLIADPSNPPPPPTGDVVADRLGNDYAFSDHPTPETFPLNYLRPVISTPAGSYRGVTDESLMDTWKGTEDPATYPDWRVSVNGTWVTPSVGNLPPVGSPKWSMVSGDFSSDMMQVIFQPDVALMVDKTTVPWLINNGIGVLRAEQENMSNGSFSADPIILSSPDENAYQWVEFQGIPEGGVGLPIAQARGAVRWCNSDLILFQGGLAGTSGTQTAFIPHGGPQLPTTHKPTNIAVTSGNEFTLITCIEKATGKGKLAVYANWTGKRLQVAAGQGAFYHDWPEPYPGLSNPAIYCGFKLLGFIDLGINNPSGISAVAQSGSDRVNAADGNAGTLGDKDLSLQSTRDEFHSGNNSTYLSGWGFAVITSKSEGKAVFVDMTALFSAYKTQYTTTQALFDATIPKNKGGNWWQEFGSGDTDWPPTFVGQPLWSPVVSATISIPTPTAVLISENGYGNVAIASEDGTLHYYQGTAQGTSGGAPAYNPAPVSTIQVGKNVTCLAYDTDPFKGGIRAGSGIFAISRGDRKIDRIDGWGAGRSILSTFKDDRLKDPVQAQVAATHGINVGILTIADYEGRQIMSVRYTDLEMVNFGIPIIPIKDGAAYEILGIMAVQGKPFDADGTNVN